MKLNNNYYERMAILYLCDGLVLAKASEEMRSRLCRVEVGDKKSISIYEGEQAFARASFLMYFTYIDSLSNYICKYFDIKSNNLTLENRFKKLIEKIPKESGIDFCAAIKAIRIYRNLMVHDGPVPIGENSWIERRMPVMVAEGNSPSNQVAIGFNGYGIELPESRARIQCEHAIGIIRITNEFLNKFIPCLGLSPEDVSTLIFSRDENVILRSPDASGGCSENTWPLFSLELKNWMKEKSISINYLRCF